MVDVIRKRCSHSGCTTIPSFTVNDSMQKFCARHANECMVQVARSTNLSDAAVQEGTTRSGCAGRKRKLRPPSSTQTRTPTGRSGADRKRRHPTPDQIPVTPAPIEIGTEESQAPVEDGSTSEPDNVKTEVEVSSKADRTRFFPVEAGAGALSTPAGDNSCAGPNGTVKTEVGIVFPSTRAAAMGELKTFCPQRLLLLV